MQGFLNINKPSGVTSAYVVGKIKKHFNLSKVGHMGTLDPLASGVLPIAIGKATRLFDYMQEKTKEYETVFTFGFSTDTLDIEGNVLNKTESIPTLEMVLSAVKKLTGKLSQIPPQFSAKKVNGKKAYELARENIFVELKPKDIEIYDFKFLEQLSDKEFRFYINCSSGTYIRSLARDLGELTNSLCTLSVLVRVKTGIFNLSKSIKLEEILAKDVLDYDIINLEKVLPNLQTYTVTEREFFKLKNGLETENVYDIKDLCFIKNNNGSLLGIANANNNIKIKTFLLEN